MKILTTESFAAARAYILTHGRPLDQARFGYHFEGASAPAVALALATYQNDDGGFGHGLEPDIRTPASSAIATSTGLAILRDIGKMADESLVAAAAGYLLATYDTVREVWPMVPPAVEDAPHAPWWTYADSETVFNGFRINPKASLLGHLYHLAAGQDGVAGLLSSASQSLMAYVETIPDEELGMHDLLALLDLASAENIPSDLQAPLSDKLRRAADHVVAIDPAGWGEYVLRPLQAAPAPDSLLAPVIDRAAIDANLDYEIQRQSADGSWDLAWTWDFIDVAAWAQAERDWKGFHAVNHLRTFAAYGRLAPV
jgi:hypothetical protein